MKIWWEKTVEYKFVCDYCDDSFLMPLDGKHETAADTIATISEKFLLIEFKKKFKDIKDEKNKFNKDLIDVPNEIKQLTLNSYNFHKLIYGELNNEKFELREINYWDGVINSNKEDRILNKKNFTKDAIQYEKFKEYIETFIKLKSTITTGSGGFSSLYDNVLGIDSEGNINQVVSLQEFAQTSLKTDLAPKQNISNFPKSKGPRM